MKSRKGKRARNPLKKRGQSSTSISTFTTTHTEREHYKTTAGGSAYEVMLGHLKGNPVTHPDYDNQVRPGIRILVATGKEWEEEISASNRGRHNNQLSFDFLEDAKTNKSGFIRASHHGILEFQKDELAEPPRIAEYLAWLLPVIHRDALVGDLVEQYPKLRLKFGKRKANFWAYMQVITSVGALITTLISKLRRSTQ